VSHDVAVQQLLIGTAALAAELAERDPRLLVLDVQFVLGDPDGGRALHARGHVPGAVHCDLDAVLAGPVRATGGRHPLPDAARLEEQLRELGVSADSRVVVYDEGEGIAAARAGWVLRWIGHEAVRILDGGLPAWIAAGQPTDAGAVQPGPRGDILARPGQLPLLDADDAAALAGEGVLHDARGEQRYRGEVEPVDRVAGHIPGALSAPAAGNLDESGRYLSPEALRRRFAQLGVREDAPVGAYCGSGVAASQEVVALTLAGFPEAALYDGSRSDWISDPRRPVARGAPPEDRVRRG
jgi:thiosulfate/3-mercaptopyruvate sulfurtransferase